MQCNFSPPPSIHAIQQHSLILSVTSDDKTIFLRQSWLSYPKPLQVLRFLVNMNMCFSICAHHVQLRLFGNRW